jgi:prepilin-type N-terminal cleavage/methylation domain-containing protein
MRVRRYAAAAGRRLASEGGYSLTELIVVLAILLIVVTALTQLFLSASTAQVDMTRRFEAQQDMRLALDRLRREVHCASTVTGTPPTSSIDITLGAYCPTNKTGGVTNVSWCTRDKNGNAPPGAGAPYSLRRYSGPSCTGTFRKEADYLTIHDVFKAFPPPPAGQLRTLSVELPVDVKPADAKQRYTLKDDIALRNATR